MAYDSSCVTNVGQKYNSGCVTTVEQNSEAYITAGSFMPNCLRAIQFHSVLRQMDMATATAVEYMLGQVAMPNRSVSKRHSSSNILGQDATRM